MAEETYNKVAKIIDSIRPALIADGGNVELIDVANGIVKVKLQGACGSCPMAQMTLKMGIEREIKRHLPEIKEVVSI
ncbi:MAG TPA: NifU family protein [bacterium]|nr:NifU family protein [bacterium]HPN43131.1 NifU family protein [bacterium]